MAGFAEPREDGEETRAASGRRISPDGLQRTGAPLVELGRAGLNLISPSHSEAGVLRTRLEMPGPNVACDAAASGAAETTDENYDLNSTGKGGRK